MGDGVAQLRASRLAVGLLAASCGSAGSASPVEPRAPPPAPVQVVEADASVVESRTAAPPAEVPEAGGAPPSSSAEVHRVSAPPPPSIDACAGRGPDPRCFTAFPAKVTCPAKFADVPKDEYCGLDGTTAPVRCPYPEGVCRCVHVPYCGGVYPSQLQMMGMKWVCGPVQRPDDCPGQASDDARCRKDGQQCGYGGCGTSTQCICKDGRYKCTTQHWAPPP
jgi:hypothetical protein